MRGLVAASRADAEPAGAGTETASAASSLTAATALTAACPATRTLTLGKTWHMFLSFRKLSIQFIKQKKHNPSQVCILVAVILILRPY